jgi:hypothetical protein
MAKTQILVITGIPPYDGEYPIDDSGFTTAEYHQIKQISGVRSGELQEALAAGDAAVAVALTAITLQRNGKVVQLGLLWEAKEDDIDVRAVCPVCQVNNVVTLERCVACGAELDAPEDEGRPLDTATNGGEPSAPDVGDETNAS